MEVEGERRSLYKCAIKYLMMFKQGRSTSSGSGRGGEGILSIYPSIKEDDIYLKFGYFCRKTDRQTLWFTGKLHFNKVCFFSETILIFRVKFDFRVSSLFSNDICTFSNNIYSLIFIAI